MDLRLALLMQSLKGATFTSTQLEALLDSRLNRGDLASVLAAVAGHPLYREFDRWVEDGRKIAEDSQRRGVLWSCRGDSDYPAGWNHLKTESPLIFSYRGTPAWQTHLPVAVVGSRTPSRDTLRSMQKELPRFLAWNPEVTLVSGGARGVDQWAHRICVDMGRPTVCLLPCGVARIYPPGFEDLAERILSTGGALVSTFSLHQEMRRHLFVTRNRWIAGMAAVTLVVEANRRSGSALTAQLACDESREVCTLPVFPFAEQGLGNLDLLAQNRASLIRDAQDLTQIVKLNATVFKPKPLEWSEWRRQERSH